MYILAKCIILSYWFFFFLLNGINALYITYIYLALITIMKHVGGNMIIVIASSALDRGFDKQSRQTNDYHIGMCCLSAKHTSFRSRSKDCLLRIKIMCLIGATYLPLSCVSEHHKIPKNCVGQVQSGQHHHHHHHHRLEV